MRPVTKSKKVTNSKSKSFWRLVRDSSEKMKTMIEQCLFQNIGLKRLYITLTGLLFSKTAKMVK